MTGKFPTQLFRFTFATLAFFLLCRLELLSAGGGGKGYSLYTSEYENVLGTSMELKISAASEREAAAAESQVLREIARLQHILSTYDSGSEYSRWFKTLDRPVKISRELFEVLQLFDQWKVRTLGALDPSAGALTILWKQAAARQQMPTKYQLDSVASEIRKIHWSLDEQQGTATHLSTTPLALNSFVKSYIMSHAAALGMQSPDVAGLILNIGGDILVSGNRREEVGIANPRADAENDLPVDNISVANRFVATSGDYRRGESIGGHWFSHIVDPRTGMPASGVISATVVAPNATDAGALATAFNVLSPAESSRIGSTVKGAEWLIITSDGKRIESRGWKDLESGTSENHRKAITPRPASANGYELTIDLELKLQTEQFVKRPYLAIWIEDQQHAAVRTLALWHQRDRYLPELKSWYLKYRTLYNSPDRSQLNSVSGATRPAGKYSVRWDGTDDKGNPVTPGIYTLKIEVSREHGTYQLMRQELDLNGGDKLFNLPANAEISSATIELKHKPGN